MRCTLLVEDDAADLAAQLVSGERVEVADGRLADRATAGCLLAHTLDDLSGEVAGVELRDGGHDPVQQHPRRGLVDVLRRRHEHDAGVAQGQVDRDVVGPVSREPVDLVDDAVGDLVGLYVLDHPHQVGTVRCARGLAGVNELGHDPCAYGLSLAEIGVTLGGDRVALVHATLLGLLLGRDAEIGDGERGSFGRGDAAGRVVVVLVHEDSSRTDASESNSRGRARPSRSCEAVEGEAWSAALQPDG